MTSLLTGLGAIIAALHIRSFKLSVTIKLNCQ
jgi:hypothetical protein